jgi:hypothetical protein
MMFEDLSFQNSLNNTYRQDKQIVCKDMLLFQKQIMSFADYHLRHLNVAMHMNGDNCIVFENFTAF